MATRKLGKYQLFERLGRGGMAEVYRAHHLSLDRFVAIKVLHAFLADDPEFKDRFEKEARNIARLKHPHIVQVYDFENDPDQENYYMVMELIDGPTLKDLLTTLEERGEHMPLSEAVRIIREAAGALAYAHSQRMIHRDVKPANLMLDHDNRVILTDFGIAKIVSGGHFTSSGGMVGTPAYMAPEQGVGEAGDERSDLYSLGVIFFQLVTGQLPYDAETPLAIILKHLNEPVPSARALNPDLPEAVDGIIQRLMAKDPRVRYQTANDLIADLERFESGAPLAVSDMPLPPPDARYDTTKLTTSPPPAAARAASAAPPRRRIPLWLWVLFGAIIGAAAFSLVQSGSTGGGLLAFLASQTPTPTFTFTVTPTDLPTLTPTDVPTQTLQPTDTTVPTDTQPPPPTNTVAPSSTATFTFTPSDTPTVTPTPSSTLTPSHTLPPTDTLTPSITPTPSVTLTPTIDITLTLIQATLYSNFQTATINACDFNYEIVDQQPIDGSSVAANQDYTRKIILRNTGSCAWERNSALMFVSGENFGAGARIIIRDRVNVGDEVVLDFVGRTPAGHELLSGTWELRTPGNIRIGQPIIISINVFGG